MIKCAADLRPGDLICWPDGCGYMRVKSVNGIPLTTEVEVVCVPEPWEDARRVHVSTRVEVDE